MVRRGREGRPLAAAVALAGVALAVLPALTPEAVPAGPLSWWGPPLAAQEPPDTVVEPPDTLIPLPPSLRPRQERSVVPEPPIPPGQAFLRALAVPGWGHASIGSYTRGGFYFAAEAATAFMLVRVAHRRSAAEDQRDLRIDQIEREARAEGVTDPADIQARVDADEGVDDARRLVESRSQQFEDWLALGVFLVLLSGADAYVSAHLTDFPQPVQVQPVATAPDRYGVSVSVSVPAGF